MSTWRELVVDALATYRLTRLVTADTILHGPRDRIVEAAYAGVGRAEYVRSQYAPDAPGDWSEIPPGDPYAPKLASLVTCRWCSGVWVAVAVVALRRLAPRWWAPVAEALAISSAAPLLAAIED